MKKKLICCNLKTVHDTNSNFAYSYGENTCTCTCTVSKLDNDAMRVVNIHMELLSHDHSCS